MNAADLRRAKNEAVQEASALCWAIFFTVLRDKFGFGLTRLRRLWGFVDEYSEAVASGELTAAEIVAALREDGFEFR